MIDLEFFQIIQIDQFPAFGFFPYSKNDISTYKIEPSVK